MTSLPQSTRTGLIGTTISHATRFLTALGVAAIGQAALAAEEGFSFQPISDESLGVYEAGKPVFVYNHGMMRREGVPGDRARSTYLHPIYGPDGEVLTDDFPKDHYHHRGLFWAWPHITVGGREYDLWMLRGLQQRFEEWLIREAGPTNAKLAVKNGWYVGDQRVLEETVRIVAHPGRGEGRALDVELTLKPVGQSVTLRGAKDKSYGGLSFRIAPGTNTVITIPTGVTRQDMPVTKLPWADLTRLLTGRDRPSGAAIFIAPTHPDFPPEWLTRHYGVLCVGWPGVNERVLEPDEEVRLGYRLWVHRGTATTKELADEYARWVRELEGDGKLKQ